MMTLEDHLVALGQDAGGNHACGCCEKELPAFTLVRDGEDDDWTCGNCRIDAQRMAMAAIEAATPVDRRSWDSDVGLALKAQRNSLLDQYAWTIRLDSPLSVASQAAFLDYLKALQSMTVRHECAVTWVWPEVPGIEFAEAPEAFEVIPAPPIEDEPVAPVVPPTVDPEPEPEPPVIEEPVVTIPLPPLDPWVEPESDPEPEDGSEGLEPPVEDDAS